MVEYNGTIDLISGIRPKNNGTFPLVNAEDVLMPDGSRLENVEYYKAETAEQIQQFLNEGKPVLVTKAKIPVTTPIIINKSHARLEFAPKASLVIAEDENGYKNHPAILITHTDEGKEPAWVKVIGPIIESTWTKDSDEHSVGIRIESLGYNNQINNIEIQQCEYGVQFVGEYDCAQQNAFYEPYICKCRYGIDDSIGGMQNTRFFGGRIENNREWGVVSSSVNLCFDGTMIQGNDLGQVKLLNAYANPYSRTPKSGGVFTNCYFEQQAGYNTAIFQLGDETEYKIVDVQDGDTVKKIAEVITDEDGDDIVRQTNGWFGSLSLVGCKFSHRNTYIARSFGRGALAPGKEEQNMQLIQMIGCACHGELLFSFPNFDHGCRLMMIGVNQGLTGRTHDNVGKGVSIQYLTNQYTRLGMTQATAISGIDAPLEYAHTRQLYLEPYGYEVYSAEDVANDPNVREGDPKVDENGNYIPKASNGNWIEVTAAPILPWREPSTGVNTGSLHYVSKYQRYGDDKHYKTPGWFVRTSARDNAVDEDGNQIKVDNDGNWGSLIVGDSRGVLDQVHGRSFLLAQSDGNSEQYIMFTHSTTLPWEHKNEYGMHQTGQATGSLHYCSNNKTWYQRITWGSDTTDAEDRWVALVRNDRLNTLLSNYATKDYVDDNAGSDSNTDLSGYVTSQQVNDVLHQSHSMDYVVGENQYIEISGSKYAYPNSIPNDPKYVTHQYTVTAGKTYRIYGFDVSFTNNTHPIALFTKSSDIGRGSLNDEEWIARLKENTILVTGSTDKVNYLGDKVVEFTPETDGYIWIATYAGRNYLSVREAVTELSCFILRSSTPGSSKKFMLTVDDSGTISATEYTG